MLYNTNTLSTNPLPAKPPLSEPPLSEPPLSEPPLSKPPLSEPPLSKPPFSEPSLSEDSELPPLRGGRGERLLPLVAALSKRAADVDDNLQEVLIHLYLNRHRYNPSIGSPEAWISRVVRNAMYNINRRPRWVDDTIPYDESPISNAPDPHDDDPYEGTPYAAAYNVPAYNVPAYDVPASDVPASDVLSESSLSEPSLSEATEAPSPWGRAGGEASGYPRTYQALSALTPKDRSIIILHADGWPVREIADELHLLPATVSRRLYKIKARLRKDLQHLRRDP